MKCFLPFNALFLALSLLMPLAARASEEVDQLIKQGEVHDFKFEPAEALKFYLPAEVLEPSNVDLLLHIARQYRHLMADASSMADKTKYRGLGLAYAQRAAALAPGHSEAHLSIAICHAKAVPLLGNKEKMETSRLLKSEVDRAIALDPSKDLAWHILGSWHQRLADIGGFKRAMASMIYGGLPAASNEEAVKCFKKAIELNPSRLIHFIELGRTYAQMGQATEARQFIEKGLAMSNVGKDDAETKQRGRETLAGL